jgi:hypoxanthine phosphoribosyltransferase
VDLYEILYTREQIHQRVGELAATIREDLASSSPLLVSVLKGSVMFLADLVRALEIDLEVDFMSISSYGAEVGRSGVVRIIKDLEQPLEGRHVIVVEDVVDTGFSLSYLLRTLKTRNPGSLKVCTLIDKTIRRIAELEVHYAGFTSDDFLIGYGLDFMGRYRNLPYIAAVKNLAALAADPDALNSLFETERSLQADG